MVKKKDKKKVKKLSFLKNLSKIDRILLLVTIILAIVGTCSIVSASSRETVVRYQASMYHFFNKHVMMLGIAGILSLMVLNIPTYLYKILSVIGFAGIGGLYSFLFIYGSIKRGNVAWFEGGGQPSEFAKPVIIIALSVFFSIYADKKNKNGEFNFYKYLIIYIIIGLVIPAITLLMGDTGTALLMTLISIIMFLAGPQTKKETIKGLSILLMLGITSFSILGMSRGYIFSNEQKERLFEFYNPCSKYEDSGYQICNGIIAMNDGKLTGLGIGKSKQKYSYIPDPHTDSIFAVVVEEAGLLGGLAILILYFIMIKRILKIANETTITRNKYICFGVTAYLFLHILFNLGGLLAIFPLTGVPLPLISYGGSFTISFLVSLAVVQRIKCEIK